MRATPRFFSLIFLGCLASGCQHKPQPPSEPTLAEQVADVRSGQSDRIQLEQHAVTDADVAQIGSLEHLQALLLDHAPLTPAGIKVLSRLPRLEHLKLREAAIDDEGAGYLANIESLQILNIPQARLT